MKESLVLGLLLFALSLGGCSPNQRIINSSAERPPDAAPDSKPIEPAKIEDEIAAMKTADFNFIYVFRRKDGAELAPDDRAFMSSNIPYEINRKTIADGGRALVIGSNYLIPAENFRALKDRFAFEDHSKPESEIMPVNTNGNSR